ncbi:MAG: hypothetical protein QOJ29_2413 [Thermoleophilaceae bacterium]|nr:hypothetical protein [Thermoleophilaceae bacterium]
MRGCIIAVVTSLVALAGVPGVADAQSPATKTITAIASGRVVVKRPAKLRSVTIGAAVEAARRVALSGAVANAREEAERLAAAAGLTLGSLQSVAELPPSPFGPYPVYGVDGTFGPGKYCGRIRTPVFKRENGRRVFQHRFRSHFGCRVPRDVSVTISESFAAS